MMVLHRYKKKKKKRLESDINNILKLKIKEHPNTNNFIQRYLYYIIAFIKLVKIMLYYKFVS